MHAMTLSKTRSSWGLLTLRLLVGWVSSQRAFRNFFSCRPRNWAVYKVGIPAPQFTGSFVGVVEILFGVLKLSSASLR